MDKIKIGIIVPDRGDRPEFTKNCERMLNKNVAYSPYIILWMKGEPSSEECDIMIRYRLGYTLFSEMPDDMRPEVIFFIENDDWYAPNYIQVMMRHWIEAGKPDLFGTNFTPYYHLKLRKYFTMRHVQRSSAMNILIKPQLKITWGLDHDPYTDLWLWFNNPQLSKALWEPTKLISVGMKHGVGKLGGKNHVDELERFINDDQGFLERTLDPESFEFYDNYFPKEKHA